MAGGGGTAGILVLEPMRVTELTAQQRAQFDADGYLHVPGEPSPLPVPIPAYPPHPALSQGC